MLSPPQNRACQLPGTRLKQITLRHGPEVIELRRVLRRPNAVLALAREGYTKSDIVPRELLEVLTYPGFLALARKYWRTGLDEMWRSLSKTAFTEALRRLVPTVQVEDLVPAPAGVRAQAVSPDGRMLDDFAFHDTRRILHVLNAPSPAATASFSIGRYIVNRLVERFS